MESRGLGKQKIAMNAWMRPINDWGYPCFRAINVVNRIICYTADP